MCLQKVGVEVSLATSKAIKWLERNLKVIDGHGHPYEVAIVAYALMLAKAASSEYAFEILAKHSREDGIFLFFLNFTESISFIALISLI